MFFRLLLLLFAAIPFCSPAKAHQPYFIPYSDWLTYNGEQYRMEGWYGDGIFTADPVRVVLRHKTGDLMAVSALGDNAAGYCPSLNYCWGFTFSASGVFPSVWRLQPEMIKATEQLPGDKKYTNRDPEEMKEFGFKASYNLLFWPVAWISQASNSPVGIFFTCLLWLVWFGFAYSVKPTKLNEYKQSNSFGKVIMKIGFGIILVFAGSIVMFLSIFYAQGGTAITSFTGVLIGLKLFRLVKVPLKSSGLVS